jgi:hypothetical protein
MDARAASQRLLLSFGEASTGALGRGAFEDGDVGSAPTPVALPADIGEPIQVASTAVLCGRSAP